MNRMHWIAVGGLAGGLVLILGLGWYFLLKPLGADYEAKLKEKSDKEAQLSQTRQRAAQFEKFKAEAENVRRDLDFFSRRLDPDFPASELYTLVDGIGHSFNFSDWTFSTKERTRTKTANLSLDEVEVTATFTSDYERLGRLMNLCLNQVRLIVPETLELSRLDDTSGRFDDTLTAVVGLKVYVSPETKKGGH